MSIPKEIGSQIPRYEELPKTPTLENYETEQLIEARSQLISQMIRIGQKPEYTVNFTRMEMITPFDGDSVPMSLTDTVRLALEAELATQGYEVVEWIKSIKRYSATDADVSNNTGVRFRPVKG